MNSIYVWGTPNEVEEDVYKTVTTILIQLFESKKLDPVVVFFPPDRMQWELGKEMIVYVSGPKIPDSEKQDLAEKVGWAVSSAFHPERIDCVVLGDEPWPGQGRWSNN